jgi:hypothetical protein
MLSSKVASFHGHTEKAKTALKRGKKQNGNNINEQGTRINSDRKPDSRIVGNS